MKKIIKILAILTLSISLVACSSEANSASVKKRIENKETFIMVAASTTCAACKSYKPILNEYSKDNKDLKIDIVHIDKISDSAEFNIEYNVKATPTTFFFKDGKRVTYKEGLLTKAELSDLVDKYLK